MAPLRLSAVASHPRSTLLVARRQLCSAHVQLKSASALLVGWGCKCCQPSATATRVHSWSQMHKLTSPHGLVRLRALITPQRVGDANATPTRAIVKRESYTAVQLLVEWMESEAGQCKLDCLWSKLEGGRERWRFGHNRCMHAVCIMGLAAAKQHMHLAVLPAAACI